MLNLTKEEYLNFWNIPLGTQEAEDAWKAKQELDNRTFEVNAPLVSIFNEGPYEHLAEKPMKFKSKKELRTYCREHNLTSDYAE